MDFPNLRKKPTYGTIFSAIQALEIQPNLWVNTSAVEQSAPIDQAAILRFLMSVIASDLEWLQGSVTINGDILTELDQREILLDLASKRVAERCGRSAMPEMTRTWVIPASANLPEFKFDIREPPLTGDNLGLKTWGTSYVIARNLESFGMKYFNHRFDRSTVYSTSAERKTLLPSTRVLELGAGTGLVGIAAGAIWGADVHLTDLQNITENLLCNIEKNSATVVGFGGQLSGGVLDWKEPDKALESMPWKKFDIILAADPLYDDDHPDLLANVIQKFLMDDKDSRALVAIPMRDNTTRSLDGKLSNLMVRNGFHVQSSGEELCRDDWESSEGLEVKLRWTFWQRNFFSKSPTNEEPPNA